MLVITAITPPQIILADTGSDELRITFDPVGQVDGNVSPESFDYDAVLMNTSEESGDFTLWNNGTIRMKCEAETNVTTEEGDMECDGNGGTLAEDFFSLNFTSTTLSGASNFISNSSGSKTELEANLTGLSSGTFKITINLGTCSADHLQQNTTVNFTFSAA